MWVLRASSGMEGVLGIRIYIFSSKMMILLLNYYYMIVADPNTRIDVAKCIKDISWQRFR